ncbi:MAG: DMT family transporter [Xanthobacteraceae bacterium]
MTPPGENASRGSAMAGFLFLMVTSVGWGLNWPVMKQLLTELPPLAARGWSGLAGAAALALVALLRRETMQVPRELWPRLVLISLLTLSTWMAFIGLALLWLRAGEAAVIASSMPVWVSLLALWILNERFSPLRAAALAVALAGLAILLGADGFDANAAKWPGVLFAISATMLVALGNVLIKRSPFQLPPIAFATWQIGIGCIPVVAASLLLEAPDFSALSAKGWLLMAYMTFVQFCVCYACWFAALERLPVSTASIGTLLIPVVGVLASAATLGEPLGLREVAALGLTVAGVLFAVRS